MQRIASKRHAEQCGKGGSLCRMVLPIQRSARNSIARQCSAAHSKASQSNAARVKAFAGWFCAIQGIEMQRSAWHGKAEQSGKGASLYRWVLPLVQRKAAHGSAKQRKAEQSGSAIGNSGLPGGFSYQRMAKQSSAGHREA